jgi:serine/threonine-protein phosphatase 4 catalytic subunit
MSSSVYGFQAECLEKFKTFNVYKWVCETFDYMPLCALIGDKVFCVHGGLSPKIQYLEEINQIDRKQEVPMDGPMNDLMWSDPSDVKSWYPSPRNAGWLFGESATKKFLENNNLTKILRAHQVALKGFSKAHDGKVLTIWSAPNYRYQLDNLACVLEIDENMEEMFKVFEAPPREVRFE